MRRNSAGDLGADAWQYMPERFVVVYSELVRRGLAGVGSSAGSYGQRRGGETRGPLGDEKALEAKKRMDRVLRRLANEHETGRKQERIKCGGCGGFVQEEWKFCAGCGLGRDLDDRGGRIVPGSIREWGRLR